MLQASGGAHSLQVEFWGAVPKGSYALDCIINPFGTRYKDMESM